MTPELIAAVVAVLGAVAAYIKSRTDISALKGQRIETAQKRDQDSLELHDAVQKLEWDTKYLKDELGFANARIDEQAKTASILTTELAKISVKLDGVLDALKDMKERK